MAEKKRTQVGAAIVELAHEEFYRKRAEAAGLEVDFKAEISPDPTEPDWVTLTYFKVG